MNKKFSRRAVEKAGLILLGLMMLSVQNAHAARPIGIDVSDYQGTSLNWTTIQGYGVSFAWTKSTEGASGQYVSQSSFSHNETSGKAVGIYMGAYHYCHPEQNAPANEASYFWSTAGSYIKADGLSLMPMLDVEGNANTGHVGASSLSDWINSWCTDVVQDAANNGTSIKPCIYVSSSHASSWLVSSVTQWNDDLADWPYAHASAATSAQAASGPPAGETPWSSWQFWQYDDENVAQAYTTGDGDIFNGTSATLLSTMVATANTNSTIYYWDPQGTAGANPYTGSMTGTWETSKWSPGSSGQSTTVAWVEGKAVCFGVHTGTNTPAFTVTMNSSHVVAGFFDGPLTPNSCDVTIQGSGTVNLASGAQGFDAVNASDGSLAYIRLLMNMAGDGRLYPEGNGQSYLYGTNSYSGGTELGFHSTNAFNGTLNINNNNSLGTGDLTFTTFGKTAAIVLAGSSAVTITNPLFVASATTNNVVGNAAGLTFTGDLALSNFLFAIGTGSTAGNQTILGGTINGTGSLVIYNSGILVMTGTNTYTGKTTIIPSATLLITNTGQLGSGSYAGAISNGGTFNYASSASQTLSGVLSGGGVVKATGGGILYLTGVNTFSNATTTVSGGSTLGVTADSGLGASTNNLTLNGGCLKNNNSSPIIVSTRTITLGSSGAYFDAGWAPSHPLTIGAKLTGSGKLLINLDGSPVVLTNSANNYTGDTVIGTNGPSYFSTGTSAWLKLGNSNVLPFGSGKGNVVIQQNYLGVLDLAGFTQTINGLSGDGVVDNTAGNGSLSVGSNNVSSTFTGVIQDTAGTLALTKVGTGTLTLGGSNTYSGNTTISAGTLALSTTGSLNSTPKITVAAGTTFDVSAIASFALSGSTTLSASGTASAATIKGGTTVNLGSQPIILAYDGSHPALTISQGALSLNGNAFTVNGSQLPVGIYVLIQQTSGVVSGSGSYSVTGTAIGAAGTVASVSVSGGTVLLTIAATTTTTLGSVTNAGYGQSVTFTVTIAPVPSGGTVQFYDNAVALGAPVSVSGATATYSTSALSVGSHPITAAFSGTPTYLASSTTGSSVQQITNNNTSTTLGPLTNALLGQSVTFTATIVPTPPDGTVQFYDNAVALGSPVNISGGVARYSTTTLSLGNHPITASYSGTTGYLGSTTASPSIQQITNNGTITTLGPLTNALVGQSVTFTATVSPTPPDGTVQFYDNAAPLGSPVNLSGATATYTTATLSVGSHPITASYSGTTGFPASSTASPSIQQITNITTATTLSPLTNVAVGQPVTFTANITPTPSGGTVQFYDNSVALGSAVVVTNAVVFYTASALAPGSHPITAAYSGTNEFAASATTNFSLQWVIAPADISTNGMTFTTNGAFSVNFSGTPGLTYWIQAATNLLPPVIWSTVGTNTADASGNINFIDTNAVSFYNRYYRTMSP